MVKQQNIQRGSKPARFNLSQSTAIIKHIHDLWHGTEPDKAVSMAVFSDGSYDVPPGLMFTMPTVWKDRSWKIKQLPIDAFVELSIKRIVREIEAETKRVMKVWEEEERAYTSLKTQD
ncbi:malate dehydrogenase, cytoplasmic-like [Schistocerca nitens]|uniref:malate dehydrogenase, cytoplasmic-like n=1 Tax=Schistocerca nitens TaxID=7011 RepID=UPI0021188AB1|nr:malate dehydrogenase, cytoplasmic-like [Schistocerca nitens]XP_049803848.1 malate dehydrogenase, cytoplasmic-like [Schistocerca nitens]